MADTLTEAVLGGVAPLPRNAPKRITFEYEPGQEIVLKDFALEMWWAEYFKMYMMFKQITTPPAPVMSSDNFHDMFDEQDKKETPKKE